MIRKQKLITYYFREPDVYVIGPYCRKAFPIEEVLAIRQAAIEECAEQLCKVKIFYVHKAKTHKVVRVINPDCRGWKKDVCDFHEFGVYYQPRLGVNRTTEAYRFISVPDGKDTIVCTSHTINKEVQPTEYKVDVNPDRVVLEKDGETKTYYFEKENEE